MVREKRRDNSHVHDFVIVTTSGCRFGFLSLKLGQLKISFWSCSSASYIASGLFGSDMISLFSSFWVAQSSPASRHTAGADVVGSTIQVKSYIILYSDNNKYRVWL